MIFLWAFCALVYYMYVSHNTLARCALNFCMIIALNVLMYYAHGMLCTHVLHPRMFFVAARLKSQAQDIEFRAELETQQQLRDAELAFQKAQGKLELEKSRQLSNLEVHVCGGTTDGASVFG